MDIVQMHSTVRELTQQMGMQHVRFILEDQIDTVLNLAISEMINTELAERGAVSASTNLPTNIKIGQINALRTLYDVATYNISSETPLMTVNLNTGHLMLSPDVVLPSVRMYYSAALSYIKDKVETEWFPIRIVEDAYLGNITSDYLTKPTFKSPVMVFRSGTQNVLFELYLGKLKEGRLIPSNGYTPNKLRLSFIKHPNKVALGCPDGKGRVECNLPEYMHERIVSTAAQLWINSVMFNKSTMREEAVRAAE